MNSSQIIIIIILLIFGGIGIAYAVNDDFKWKVDKALGTNINCEASFENGGECDNGQQKQIYKIKRKNANDGIECLYDDGFTRYITCDDDNETTIAPGGSENETTTAPHSCQNDVQCHQGFCNNGKCRALLNNGDFCNYDNRVCSSGLCLFTICQPQNLNNGSVCRHHTQCISGHCDSQNVCNDEPTTPLLTRGEFCTNDAECQSGICLFMYDIIREVPANECL
jgi:hypothetical protein